MPDQVKKTLTVQVDIKGKKDLIDARTAMDRLNDAINEYRRKTKNLHGAALKTTEQYILKLRDQKAAVKDLMDAEKKQAKEREDALKKEAQLLEERQRKIEQRAKAARMKTAMSSLSERNRQRSFWSAPSLSRAWRERVSPTAKLQRTLQEQQALEEEGLKLSIEGETEEERKAGAEQAASAGKAADAASKKLGAVSIINSVYGTAKKMAGEFNSMLKSTTGMSLSIKDAFHDVLQSVVKMLDMRTGMATYNMGTSLITNAQARQTQLKYGFTGGQAYAFTQTASMLGISGDEDLAYMNPRQRQVFQTLMQKQEQWYTKLESSGVLEDIQQMQIDFAMFKQEIGVEFLDWIAKNKETIMTVLKGMFNILKMIVQALSAVFSLFGVKSSDTSFGYNSTALSDAVAAGTAATTNNKNVNVSMRNNVNGVFNQKEMEDFLNERLNTTFRAAALAM